MGCKKASLGERGDIDVKSCSSKFLGLSLGLIFNQLLLQYNQSIDQEANLFSLGRPVAKIESTPFIGKGSRPLAKEAQHLAVGGRQGFNLATEEGEGGARD